MYSDSRTQVIKIGLKYTQQTTLKNKIKLNNKTYQLQPYSGGRYIKTEESRPTSRVWLITFHEQEDVSQLSLKKFLFCWTYAPLPSIEVTALGPFHVEA